MQHQWFSNLPKNQQDDRKVLIENSEKVLDILQEIVYNMSIVESKSVNTDYDSPSWAFKQAHSNGKLDAYREVISLLKVSKDHN